MLFQQREIRRPAILKKVTHYQRKALLSHGSDTPGRSEPYSAALATESHVALTVDTPFPGPRF